MIFGTLAQDVDFKVRLVSRQKIHIFDCDNYILFLKESIIV